MQLADRPPGESGAAGGAQQCSRLNPSTGASDVVTNLNAQVNPLHVQKSTRKISTGRLRRWDQAIKRDRCACTHAQMCGKHSCTCSHRPPGPPGSPDSPAFDCKSAGGARFLAFWAPDALASLVAASQTQRGSEGACRLLPHRSAAVRARTCSNPETLCQTPLCRAWISSYSYIHASATALH